ncbi:MAG: lipid A deacylase LpxR family protein [Bacteroidota bacterium]
MRKAPIYICFLICLFALRSNGQAIDNTLSYKNINSDSYFRLNYENDFFSATDLYYTQGIHAEIASPVLKYNPINKILIHLHWRNTKYGLAIEHDGYTPSSLLNDKILYGDRPYASVIMLKSFMICTDTIHMQRFSTTLVTGDIGPSTGGEQMQKGIHRALDGIQPRGWSHQIQNDIELNYQVDYEKQILCGKYYSIDADAMARAGTLSDKAGIGITAILGLFQSPFITKSNRKFAMYFYEHTELASIGYDATLQGGLFDRNNPYTIDNKQIMRLTFQNRYGVAVAYKRLYLEYFQAFITKEFSTGSDHHWGGIQIAFTF